MVLNAHEDNMQRARGLGYRLKKKCKIGVKKFCNIKKFAITTTMI